MAAFWMVSATRWRRLPPASSLEDPALSDVYMAGLAGSADDLGFKGR